MRKRFHCSRVVSLGAALIVLSFFLACSSTDGGLKGIGDGDPAGSGASSGAGAASSVGGSSGSTTSACLGACVDLSTDPSNCGACGAVCDMGSSCKSGACEGCASGQDACGSVCLNLQTDSSNCGVCGSACNLGAACVAGACETCQNSETDCNGVCVDTSLNPSNCGACGNVCVGSEVCSAGSCIENTCGGSNELPCGQDGACTDVNNNVDNCGACGQVCGDVSQGGKRLACIAQSGNISRCGCYSGEACATGCEQTESEVKNCGGCGIECPSAQFCEKGVCRCGGGQVLCDGACKNPEQCSGGATNLGFPDSDILASSGKAKRFLIAPGGDLGDGSVDCSPMVVDSSSGGQSSTGSGGTSGGDEPIVVTDPNAGDHCGGGDTYNGKSTWYKLVTPLVHCGYPTDSLPKYYGAINDAQYATADVCGACVEITSGGKTLEVEIVDECPLVGNETWCYAGSNHIDLNPAAFEYFSPKVTGVFEMTWKFVPCSSPGDLSYTIKAGSSIYWTGILIRNHPVPLASVEVAGPDGVFQALTQQEYNYWLLETGFGTGPYTLRVIDTSGAVLEKTGIPTLTSTELADADVTSTPLGSQLLSCQ